MIYEIEDKIYVKVDNFYSEIVYENGNFKPTKELHKIYCEDVNEELTTFTFDEYRNRFARRRNNK